MISVVVSGYWMNIVIILMDFNLCAHMATFPDMVINVCMLSNSSYVIHGVHKKSENISEHTILLY